jgi:hypothetical protein
MSFHLALKAGSNPGALLRIWNIYLVASSGKFLIKQPAPRECLEREAIKYMLGGFRGNLFRCHLPFLPLNIQLRILLT